MKKHKVIICTGTACFVMGGSELLLLEEQLSDELKAVSEVEGSSCLGICKRSEHGKAQADYAPFVQIDGVVMEQASAHKIIEYLETQEGHHA
jgi:NADH:ubiquinone oxidoreductase subunit E